ncbi:MAG: hypothetical protein GY749_02655 [Desulfobacteraceae bacterium]|nr:hypothetical protein [Desulfobacteraceae bacterium]
MDPLIRQTQKKYCSGAMTTAIVIGFICILAGQKPIGKGVILGTVFSVVNFVIIGETLPKRIAKSKSKAAFLSLGSIFFRYLLLAVPLIMGVRLEQFNLAAVVVGIFLIQLVIIADHLFNLILPSRKKQV